MALYNGLMTFSGTLKAIVIALGTISILFGALLHILATYAPSEELRAKSAAWSSKVFIGGIVGVILGTSTDGIVSWIQGFLGA